MEAQVAAPEYTPEQLDAMEEAAFNAAYNKVADEPAPPVAPSVEPDKAPEGEPLPPAEEEKIVFAGLTESQLTNVIGRISEIDALKSTLDEVRNKLSGEIGGIKSQIKSAKEKKPEVVHTPVFSQKAKDRLAAEFPELGQILFGDDEAQAAPTPAAKVNEPEAVEPKVDINQLVEQRLKEKLEEVEAKNEIKILSAAHPDWEDIRNSAEFLNWKNALPSHERNNLDASWDASYISGKLAEYKTWQAKRVSNASRLSDAVTPKGVMNVNTPQNAIDEEEAAMAAAFNRVKQKI